jgi:hypothetical protein
VIRIRDLACGTAALVAVLVMTACGGGSKSTTGHLSSRASPSVTTRSTQPPSPPRPSYPRILKSAISGQPTAGFVPALTWHGQTAAWIARTTSGIALLSFNQQLLELHLHSGTIDAGAGGWHFGPSVAGSEARHLIGAFNGGFKFSTGAGGFESYGRTAVSLRKGLGSIVTYIDGTTDIGSWHQEVPMPGKSVASVRQNLTLLIDHGTPTSMNCGSCWGATLGGVVDPARSALGITSDGRVIWIGGEHLTVAALADALLGARVVRAVELDINPEWVAAYLYGHRGGRGPLAPVSVVPGQQGIPGRFLAPWSRDFFTVVAK